jgi:hypothetical protein
MVLIINLKPPGREPEIFWERRVNITLYRLLLSELRRGLSGKNKQLERDSTDIMICALIPAAQMPYFCEGNQNENMNTFGTIDCNARTMPKCDVLSVFIKLRSSGG